MNSNRRHGKNDPPVAIKTYKDSVYVREVAINGPCKLVYRPDKPLKCGATLWIETESEVSIETP
jgi:hypothetical protein